MCCENIQFASNLGKVLINAANPNLNGTGNMGLVLTANSAPPNARGTTVKSVIIKSIGNTTLGMVRLFIDDGVTRFLYKEVMIPANNQTSVVQAFTATIDEPFMLQPGYALYASTQNAESFNVIAVGEDSRNCSC